MPPEKRPKLPPDYLKFSQLVIMLSGENRLEFMRDHIQILKTPHQAPKLNNQQKENDKTYRIQKQ